MRGYVLDVQFFFIFHATQFQRQRKSHETAWFVSTKVKHF